MADNMIWCKGQEVDRAVQINLERRPERTNTDAFTCSNFSQLPVKPSFIFYDHTLIEYEGKTFRDVE